MEFLKELFPEGQALTYDQLAQAAKGKGFEVVNAAGGAYVPKSQYDLITVDRGGLMVNMDSQAPNRLFAEWAEAGGFGDVTDLKPEQTYGASRFDFSMMRHGLPTFVEVKGVTLEREGAALFPDAPTERGVRHLRELIDAKAAGYGTAICFVIQMKGPAVFRPNRATHPAFSDALCEASAAGVRILALDVIAEGFARLGVAISKAVAASAAVAVAVAAAG